MSESSNTGTARLRGRGRSRVVRARSSYRTGSFEVFSYPRHSTPVVVCGALWRWRVELQTLTVLALAWTMVAHELPEAWPGWSTPVVLGTTILAIMIVPGSRRFVMRRVWCVISRHRVRKCFVQSRVMTHEGLLPLFIWSRPTPVGERLRLWLRPGLSSRDVEGVVDRIAAACWARGARVQVSTKRASTVWVEVIRRDPLAATGRIHSPLLDGIRWDHVGSEGELVPLPDRSAVMPVVMGEGASNDSPAANSVSVPRTAAKRSSARIAVPVEESAAVAGWSGGEDVSDYV
jgi:hypothetical protein